MLVTTLTLTPEDLRILHHLHTNAAALAQYFDKVTIDDKVGRLVVRPLSEDELQLADKLSLRACMAMYDTFNALPADHPDVIANLDKAELWTPFPHQIEQIRKRLES